MQDQNIYKKLFIITRKYLKLIEYIDYVSLRVSGNILNTPTPLFDGIYIELESHTSVAKFYTDHMYAYAVYEDDVANYNIVFKESILDDLELAKTHYNSLFSTYKKLKTVYPEIKNKIRIEEIEDSLSYHKRKIKELKKELDQLQIKNK